jgi:hypothetical protein
MQTRRARLLGDTDPAVGLGVEIGALHSPIISRADGRVLYVDYMPTEWLRANLRHPGVAPADVLEVDIVWNGQSLAEALGEPADYLVASHVIEHVPDLIDWLAQIRAALRPGGLVGLAIPDRRATFDVARNDATIAEVVEAHLDRRTRPSLRQILDAGAFAAIADDERGWRAEQGRGLPASVLAALPELYRWLRDDIAPAPRYVDVHCWVFTPASFLALAEALAAIGCFPYCIEAFYPTDPGEIEFQTRLRATDAADPDIAASIARVRTRLADPLPAAADCAEIEALAAHNTALTQALQTMRDASFWRATAPLRALARFLHAARHR